MQVAAAYLTSPGWRPEAERRWRQSIVLSWPRFDSDAQSVMASEGMRLLASGDKRFGSSPDDGVINRSFTELRAYLEGAGAYQIGSPRRKPREDDTEQRILNEEVETCISTLPPEVDKLRQASELLLLESRKLRLESRKTRDSSSHLVRVIPKN